MTAPAQESSEVPHGSAGIANGSVMPTVEPVGDAYGVASEAAVGAAMSKRDADQAVLDK